MEELFTIIAIVAIVVLIVYVVKKNKKNMEEAVKVAEEVKKQAQEEAKKEAQQQQYTEDIEDETISQGGSTARSLEDELTQQDQTAETQEEQKESFTSIDTTNAKVKAGGVIVGPRLFTDGETDLRMDQYSTAILNDTYLDGVQQQIAGAGFGDNFNSAFSNHLAFIDAQSEKGSVKTNEEIAKISKTLETQNNAQSCMLTRGGATRAKLLLDPLGTAGVLEGGSNQPERDKDRTIRMVSHVIPVPKFDMDTNRISDHVLHERSLARALAAQPTKVVKVAAAQPEDTVTVETESYRGKFY